MTLYLGLRDDEWCGQLVVTMKDFNLALENLKLSVSFSIRTGKIQGTAQITNSKTTDHS